MTVADSPTLAERQVTHHSVHVVRGTPTVELIGRRIGVENKGGGPYQFNDGDQLKNIHIHGDVFVFEVTFNLGDDASDETPTSMNCSMKKAEFKKIGVKV